MTLVQVSIRKVKSFTIALNGYILIVVIEKVLADKNEIEVLLEKITSLTLQLLEGKEMLAKDDKSKRSSYISYCI